MTDLQKLKSNFANFRASLDKESDRGCALLAAAYIEVKLEELLKCVLVDNRKIVCDIFNFVGPLATFSAKAKMSYLLGLVENNILDDIDIIRKKRNEFAHSPSYISFDHSQISK